MEAVCDQVTLERFQQNAIGDRRNQQAHNPKRKNMENPKQPLEIDAKRTHFSMSLKNVLTVFVLTLSLFGSSALIGAEPADAHTRGNHDSCLETNNRITWSLKRITTVTNNCGHRVDIYIDRLWPWHDGNCVQNVNNGNSIRWDQGRTDATHWTTGREC